MLTLALSLVRRVCTLPSLGAITTCPPLNGEVVELGVDVRAEHRADLAAVVGRVGDDGDDWRAGDGRGDGVAMEATG